MKVPSNKLGDIRNYYRRLLATKFSERTADTMVYEVLSVLTGRTRAQVLGYAEERVSESEMLRIHFAFKDLMKDKPLQYVLGYTEFFGYRFQVSPKVLIPRPETEELVEKALELIPEKSSWRILDAGTGSGCIAVTLALKRPDIEVVAIDKSEFALEVATENAHLNHADVRFLKLDMLDKKALKSLGPFNMIISNPPYVRESEKKNMAPHVVEWEPPQALFVPDNDPLLFYKALAWAGKNILAPDGYLLCEINQYLADETLELFRISGYSSPELLIDLNKNPRMIIAEL
ncbi:MAG: peptide chain release factor N(5)-glutamine methyltransferase [Bacteroidales bacterium]